MKPVVRLRACLASLSPLTEGRGLKHIERQKLYFSIVVAPHGGAWIETTIPIIHIFGLMVAPHGGAWIETIKSQSEGGIAQVAPHGGAWIET